MKIKCVVVDDEPLAQQGMKEYIREISFLDLVAVCDNAMQVYPLLNNNKADLILLDIEMPQLSGIDFLKSLKQIPAVIFTTAYPQYALQGYDLDVIDYLVKPISFQRFLKAAEKARNFLADKFKPGNTLNESNYFFVKANHQIEKIFYNDVLFIEALQNYIAIYLADRKIISYMPISNMEKQLPQPLFMRIHKSYIAALNKIDCVKGNKVTIQTRSLPLSRNVKDKLIAVVQDKLIKR